ncbi:hypothetical protein NCC49_004538 [Naganishia albida]|nr:hypothetical protein NCC49_004538 [Naganishia albida]
MGKRLVLKIERNNGGRYTFTRNEEDHPAYQGLKSEDPSVVPLNPTQRAEFARQADRIRHIASGLQESESVTFTITRTRSPNLLFSTLCPARISSGGALSRMRAAQGAQES